MWLEVSVCVCHCVCVTRSLIIVVEATPDIKAQCWHTVAGQNTAKHHEK